MACTVDDQKQCGDVKATISRYYPNMSLLKPQTAVRTLWYRALWLLALKWIKMVLLGPTAVPSSASLSELLSLSVLTCRKPHDKTDSVPPEKLLKIRHKKAFVDSCAKLIEKITVENRHVNASGILSKRWPVDVCPRVSSAVVDYMANPTSHRQHQHQGHVFVYFFLACKKNHIL